jgi:hypothetical protein
MASLLRIVGQIMVMVISVNSFFVPSKGVQRPKPPLLGTTNPVVVRKPGKPVNELALEMKRYLPAPIAQDDVAVMWFLQDR